MIFILQKKKYLNYLSYFLKKIKKEKKYLKCIMKKMSKFCKDGSAILLGAFYKNVLVGFHWAYEINWGGRNVYTVIS